MVRDELRKDATQHALDVLDVAAGNSDIEAGRLTQSSGQAILN